MNNFKQFAKTPPMGWNSWDCFGAAVNEKQLIENAEYMAKHLKKYGWQYVVCDIQWYEPNAKNNDYNHFTELNMDEYGRLMPAPNRFPSAKDGGGFKSLADKIHNMGLKFGIHIMRGIPRQATATNTPIYNSKYTAREITHPFSICSWNTDMYGLRNCEGAQDYYDSIINMYASWGVDFIKCDDICVTEFRKADSPYDAYYEIEMIRNSIDRCGRDIVLSLSPGPADIQNVNHLSENANMWRLTGDFWDQWEKLHDMFSRCRTWQGVPREGNWPDCDMLPLGKLCKNGAYISNGDRFTNFTKDEQITMMTLWGIFRSPLMIGGNMPENDEFTLNLLTNAEYINMLNNSYSAKEVFHSEENNKGTIIWTANGDNCNYIAIFNTKDDEDIIGIDAKKLLNIDSLSFALDIWKNEKINIENLNHISINAHGASLIKITK